MRRPGAGRPTCSTCSEVLESRPDKNGVYVARCPKCSPAEWMPRNIEGARVSLNCFFFFPTSREHGAAVQRPLLSDLIFSFTGLFSPKRDATCL